MKYIENQVSSSISNLRSRIRGRLSPERAALEAANKIDSAASTTPQNILDKDMLSNEEDLSVTPSKDHWYENEEVLNPGFSSVTMNSSDSTFEKISEHNQNVIQINENEQFRNKDLLKPVILKSDWNNSFIKAAIPSLLTVLHINNKKDAVSYDPYDLKLQLIREVEKFQRTLSSQQNFPEDIHNLAYMLCTFLDGKITETGIYFDVSLLVHFYKDAWGGEKCFEHLDMYLEKPNQNKSIIEFYNLILSLGFLGKYGIIEQGAILLNDLKSKLHNILYSNNLKNNLTHLLDYDVLAKSIGILTPLRLFLTLLSSFLIIYALVSFYLHSLSRDLRNEILAWQPPVLTVIQESPPPELIEVLNEGWLQIKEHPLGWLLIFTSDGAFNVGSAELTKEFKEKKNIERLGNALSNYPGDLVVIGHTDNTQYVKGSSGSNQQLSHDRAQTVAMELQNGSGINKHNERKISYEGKGDTEPLASNTTPEGRTKNRRVDILWKIGRKEKNEVIKFLNESSEMITTEPLDSSNSNFINDPLDSSSSNFINEGDDSR